MSVLISLAGRENKASSSPQLLQLHGVALANAACVTGL